MCGLLVTIGQMKIQKINDNIVITIPAHKERSNPYDDENHEIMDTVVGVFYSAADCGLAYRIDMDYKGKTDQWTGNFLEFEYMPEEDFIATCKLLDIDYIIEYEYQEPDTGQDSEQG